MKKFFYILLGFWLLFSPLGNFAFETDQFNLPPEPLADIGVEVYEYVRENVEKGITKINEEIKKRQQCLENPAAKNCESREKNLRRLNYLRSEQAVAREVFNRLGSGFPPFTASGSWMESHEFKVQPARYKTNREESIYATSPINYLTISRTVNVYGDQFGTDKIAHIFQQGYTYLRIYERALAKNVSNEAAIKKANDWGRRSERTFYGNLVSGVYSNADLAANFAGFKFYLNLTKEIKIGDKNKLPLVVLENGFWQFNENINLQENLLKPFVTAHLNEALNPSIYTNVFKLRSSVRGRVKKNACDEWIKRYIDSTRADYEKQTRRLRTWFGEDYGFTESKHFITIGNTCFDE